MINNLHHVAVICSDHKVSRRFYSEILGFKVIREVYRADRDSYKIDLEIPGGVQIELFSFPNPPMRLSYPEARGLRHLAFLVEDVPVMIDALNSHGIICEMVRIDEFTGKKFTFFKDPDGLPIEIYEQ